MTASEQYESVDKQIDEKLARIAALMAKHNDLQDAAPNNYGYVGDAVHVRDMLDEVIDFLRLR